MGMAERENYPALLEHVHGTVQEIRAVMQEAEKERVDISEALERHAIEMEKVDGCQTEGGRAKEEDIDK